MTTSLQRTKDQHSSRTPGTINFAVRCQWPTRVEQEYFREGAWTYIAARDVSSRKVFGRCEGKSVIAHMADGIALQWTFTRRDLHTLLAKIPTNGWHPQLARCVT